jgi:hypothetical protein
MRLDPGGAPDDLKLIGFGYFGPNGKVSDWIADGLAEVPIGIGMGGRNIPHWCRHRVGTVKSFLDIDICRCLDAKTSCKINEAG